MDKAVVQAVRVRAKGLCEYCHSDEAFYAERFQIDHVIARQHGGLTILENLALCCIECNRRKGPNLSGIDPLTLQRSHLFDPRNDVWNDHFSWRVTTIVGRTEKGRATVAVLDMNRPARVLVRDALLLEKVFPPAGDRTDQDV